MKNIDQHIKEALAAEDASLAEQLDEKPSIFDLIGDTFKGRLRYLNMLGVFFALLFQAVAIVCAIRFFQVDSTREMIAWAIGFSVCMAIVGFVKIWYWLELTKHALMREVKRVELEIAALASRMRSGDDAGR